jgi:hypothetical protein
LTFLDEVRGTDILKRIGKNAKVRQMSRKTCLNACLQNSYSQCMGKDVKRRKYGYCSLIFKM